VVRALSLAVPPGQYSDAAALRTAGAKDSIPPGRERPGFLERSKVKISELMNSPPIAIPPEATVQEAAVRMEEDAVGAVLVADKGVLRGIVTDRDLAVRAIAHGRDPEETAVCELMSAPVTTIEVTDDVDTVYHRFRRSAIRRLPVVDGDQLVGVLSLDDLLMDVFQRMADLLGPVAWSVLREPPGDTGMACD
jgi:signal-transduction protein with cAMP-binding, CBS, and nucleotidyltransferase domain